jgi:peptidoglycan/xylan/chitin deacetylase (PgdA/CDA1 family)
MSKHQKSEQPVGLEAAFDVSDPVWYDRAEDVALRCVTHLGVALDTLFGRRANLPGILTYHRIAPCIAGLPAPTHNVTPASFRCQLEGLLDRGFEFWPLDRLLHRARKGTPVPSQVVVVTFDDGFETVYTEAWPVLQELEIPATLFVSTAYLGSDVPFPFDEWGVRYAFELPQESYRPLTPEQCDEMVASGVFRLGAHTHTHEDFRGRHDVFAADLQDNVDHLRQRFGLTEVPFAFPFGSSSRGFSGGELVGAAKDTGVVCGLTTDPLLVDPASDPFAWGRFNAFPWDTGASLAAKLDGWYSWAPQLKRGIVARLRRRHSHREIKSPLPLGGKA